MALVGIKINEREYQVVCDDGKEDHLLKLGKKVDERVRNLVTTVGRVGEARLLVMVSVLLADELESAYQETRTTDNDVNSDLSAEMIEEKMIRVIDAAAGRIESVSRDISR